MAAACPDPPTLRSLLKGELLDPDSARWEVHLEHCPTCVETAAALTVQDPLAREARQAMIGPPLLLFPPAEFPVVRSALERARSLCRSSGSGPTDSGIVRPELLSFLQAPRRPDELGQLGPYRVLRLLGAGAMGLVFLAEDARLRRTVALKVLHPRLTQKPEARARFLREARAMATITHAHIVSVYHVEETAATPFLAMPVLDGLPLNAWLKRHPSPPLATILRWGREIASGLAAAHERGLIHRDVKPSNLWVEGTGEHVKILDFGLAYFDRDEVHLTASGVIVGTPAYMAPEQARGAAPDPRADLFSLGCVLYELCTGVPPFRGESVLAVLSALANDEPAPVRSHNPAIPVAVEALVMRLLAKQPAQRPATAHAVAAALAALEAAPQASGPRRARPRWLIAASLVAAVFSAAGGIWWSKVQTPQPEKKTDPPTKSKVVVEPGTRLPERLVGHTETVTGLVFPPGGQTLVSASADGTVRLWTLPAGTGKTLTTHPTACTALALSADGRTLASGSRDGLVRLDNLETGKLVETFTEPEHVWGLAFGRNSLFYVATNRGVVIWGLGGNGRDPRFFANHQTARMVAVDPKGKFVIAGTEEKFLFIRYLSPPGGRQIVEAHKGPLHVGVFSPDGEILATAGGPPDPAVRLWDRKEIDQNAGFPRPRIPQQHSGGATAIAWSPDGSVIASGGVDGVVRLWDPNTGNVRAELRQHTPSPAGGVTCLAFSPDGRILASGGTDKIIRLHDVSALCGPPKR